MNKGPGATPLDIQRGICETGYRGNEKVTDTKREDACARADMSVPADQKEILLIGASSVAAVLLLLMLGYLIFRRKRTGKK